MERNSPSLQLPHLLFCVALHICVMSSNRLQCLQILQNGNKLYSSEYVPCGHGRHTASLFFVHFLSTNVPGGQTVHGRHFFDFDMKCPFLQRRLRHLALRNGLHGLSISLPDGHCLHGLHLRPRFLEKVPCGQILQTVSRLPLHLCTVSYPGGHLLQRLHISCPSSLVNTKRFSPLHDNGTASTYNIELRTESSFFLFY